MTNIHTNDNYKVISTDQGFVSTPCCYIEKYPTESAIDRKRNRLTSVVEERYT